jgi:hypothetical protein
MKTKTVVADGVEIDTARLSGLLKEAVKEMQALHKANKATDTEIQRLRTATRKNLSTIRKNLRHVQADR